MAHFAKLDENNNVLFVTPLEDSICNDDEATGIAYLTKVHNWPYWRKTSYNTYCFHLILHNGTLCKIR